MKRLLPVLLIALLGMLTMGHKSQEGSTGNKIETKTSSANSGVTTAETTLIGPKRKTYLLLWGSGLVTAEAPVSDAPATGAHSAF
jgi:hypothetical protein